MVHIPRDSSLIQKQSTTISIVGEWLGSSTHIVGTSRYQINITIQYRQFASILAFLPVHDNHANSTTTLNMCLEHAEIEGNAFWL
jgi:hypothetical protein